MADSTEIHRVTIGDLIVSFPPRASDELGPLVHRLLTKLSSRFTSLAAQVMDIKQMAKTIMDEAQTEEQSMSTLGTLLMDGLDKVDWPKIADDIEAIISELSYEDVKLLAQGAIVAREGEQGQALSDKRTWNKVTQRRHGLVYRIAKEAIVAEGLLDFTSHWAGSEPKGS